jgi:hypothetical protein
VPLFCDKLNKNILIEKHIEVIENNIREEIT